MKITKTVNHGNTVYRVAFTEEGQEKRRFFKTKREAEQFGATKRKPDSEMAQWLRLPLEKRTDAMAALAIAERAGFSLVEAADAYQRAFKGTDKKPGEAWQEFEHDKLNLQGVRAKTWKALRLQAGKFVASLPHDSILAIDCRRITEYMAAHQWTASSRNAFLSAVSTFCRWCVKKGYLARDPSEAVPRAIVHDREIRILLQKQARALMRACEKVDRALLPYPALALFAGIRPTELERLQWDDIDLKAGVINLCGQRTKTRRSRLVHIRPNLKAFLKACDSMPTTNIRRRFKAVREAAGLQEWHPDVMRHSFASYLIPLEGMAHTATESGNSEQVLLKHYRKPIKKADAYAFFSIAPTNDKKRSTRKQP